MAKAFSAAHKNQLTQHGVTDAQAQLLTNAGCDPEKCVAGIPQLRAQVEAAGLDWNKWFELFMKILPLVMQFFGPQPGPTPAPNPNVPPATH
jgi:hypothetical protein